MARRRPLAPRALGNLRRARPHASACGCGPSLRGSSSPRRLFPSHSPHGNAAARTIRRCHGRSCRRASTGRTCLRSRGPAYSTAFPAAPARAGPRARQSILHAFRLPCRHQPDPHVGLALRRRPHRVVVRGNGHGLGPAPGRGASGIAPAGRSHPPPSIRQGRRHYSSRRPPNRPRRTSRGYHRRRLRSLTSAPGAPGCDQAVRRRMAGADRPGGGGGSGRGLCPLPAGAAGWRRRADASSPSRARRACTRPVLPRRPLVERRRQADRRGPPHDTASAASRRMQLNCRAAAAAQCPWRKKGFPT